MEKEVERRKKKTEFAITAVLIILAVICLTVMTVGSNQSIASIPIKESFNGEYSLDGGQWRPLNEEAISELSALDGELTVRVHFDYEAEQGTRLNFYLNHIGYRISVNGELCMESTMMEIGFLNDMCGSRWENIFSPGITPEDEVEITLVNPHRYGNESAYRDFLDTLYIGPDYDGFMSGYMKQFGQPLRMAGLIAIIAAIMLMGAAAAAAVSHLPASTSIFRYGVMTFFAGGYTMLDTVDVSFVSSKIVFNTYGKGLCIMLFAVLVCMCVSERLTGARQKTAKTAAYMGAAAVCIMIFISLSGISAIYDMYLPWTVMQATLSMIMIFCCIGQIREADKKDRYFIISFILLHSALLLDLAGIGASIYSHFTVTKIVFAILFILHAGAMAKNIIVNYKTAYRAEILEKELEESRISIMLSQIQPHFIYNTLGTIHHFCMNSPEKAAELVDDFSMYLRGNFSELDNREPIPVSREMDHVKHYVNIEKVRFPDIEIDFSLNSEDFMLPALSVQPLVENAIKHGLMGLEKGGRVEISTYETEKAYCVCVKDNGVGFDVSAVHDGRKHVGIQNTERRIEAMCGGNLKVESIVGKGTTALISIPKEDVK